MKKFNFIREKFQYNGEEKISKISLFFLLILDIFVYISINFGIEFQTEIILNPDVEYPYNCRKFTTSEEKDLKHEVYDFYYYESGRYDSIERQEADSKCSEIIDLAKMVYKSKSLEQIKQNISNFQGDKAKVENKIFTLKRNYDTVLLEKIADQNVENSILEDNLSAQNIKLKLLSLQNELSEIQAKIDSEYNSFFQDTVVINLLEKIKNYKQIINEEYESDLTFFSLKIYLIELIFILPLSILFYKLMERNRLNLNFVHYTVYKHIFVVSLIPLFTTVLSLIYDYLPKKFIANLIEFFYNLEIPFFVYYLMIGISVVFTMFLILKIQQFIRNREKNGISFVNSYKKSECVKCQNRVNYETMEFCPYCANELKVKCENCGELKIKNMRFCHKCGN